MEQVTESKAPVVVYTQRSNWPAGGLMHSFVEVTISGFGRMKDSKLSLDKAILGRNRLAHLSIQVLDYPSIRVAWDGNLETPTLTFNGDWGSQSSFKLLIEVWGR